MSSNEYWKRPCRVVRKVEKKVTGKTANRESILVCLCGKKTAVMGGWGRSILTYEIEYGGGAASDLQGREVLQRSVEHSWLIPCSITVFLRQPDLLCSSVPHSDVVLYNPL